MNKYFKAGILTTTLVLPALIILMLHKCATNHFDLPYYVPKIDTLTGNVMMNGKDTVFHTIPNFELIDQNGDTITEKTVKDRIYVADFIFTRCGTICPKMTTQLARIQKEFANDSVLILSHTVDPRFDTPEVLKGYAKRYNTKEGTWYFLTGSKQKLYDLAHKGYFIAAREEEKKMEPDQTFSHSDKLILIDKKGHIRGFYDGTDPVEIDRLKAEIKVLRSHK